MDMPNIGLSGVKVVASAGTAVPLISEDLEIVSVDIQAMEGNDDKIALGGSNVQAALVKTGAVIFDGEGLDDAASAGTYTGVEDSVIEVVIDSEGSPDTFKHRQDGGAWTTGVAITGAAQNLYDGVQIDFNAVTGHTEGDSWTINATVRKGIILGPLGVYSMSLGNLKRVYVDALTSGDGVTFNYSTKA